MGYIASNRSPCWLAAIMVGIAQQKVYILVLELSWLKSSGKEQQFFRSVILHLPLPLLHAEFFRSDTMRSQVPV
jgi:hypothetical protein